MRTLLSLTACLAALCSLAGCASDKTLYATAEGQPLETLCPNCSKAQQAQWPHPKQEVRAWAALHLPYASFQTFTKAHWRAADFQRLKGKGTTTSDLLSWAQTGYGPASAQAYIENGLKSYSALQSWKAQEGLSPVFFPPTLHPADITLLLRTLKSGKVSGKALEQVENSPLSQTLPLPSQLAMARLVQRGSTVKHAKATVLRGAQVPQTRDLSPDQPVPSSTKTPPVTQIWNTVLQHECHGSSKTINLEAQLSLSSIAAKPLPKGCYTSTLASHAEAKHWGPNAIFYPGTQPIYVEGDEPLQFGKSALMKTETPFPYVTATGTHQTALHFHVMSYTSSISP